MFKHRRKQEKKHRNGEIPVGSFSDIAFLLIIYFLLATTLIKVHAITADMPSGEKQVQSQKAEKTPLVKVTPDAIRFNDDKVTLEALNDRLAALKLSEKPKNQRVVMLESIKGVEYQLYYKAMTAISKNDGIIAMVEED